MRLGIAKTAYVRAHRLFDQQTAHVIPFRVADEQGLEVLQSLLNGVRRLHLDLQLAAAEKGLAVGRVVHQVQAVVIDGPIRVAGRLRVLGQMEQCGGIAMELVGVQYQSGNAKHDGAAEEPGRQFEVEPFFHVQKTVKVRRYARRAGIVRAGPSMGQTFASAEPFRQTGVSAPRRHMLPGQTAKGCPFLRRKRPPSSIMGKPLANRIPPTGAGVVTVAALTVLVPAM